ncbi:Pyruvate/Phosphoenolpyruvate kinase-like domain [Phytophthora cactorum]|nr:Pyruvate/Phosphoenolpyruvate kinase-like domain [Phytophthora cactorum]
MSAALSLNLKSVDCIKANVEGVQRKTKIFCTLGPACWSEEGLLELIDAGMNVARFNFSHGDHASHLSCLTRLRGALAKRPNKNVAIMLDTKGPEIRTGFLANKGKVTIQKDSLIELTTDYEFLGDETKIACSYPQLPQSVKVGGSVLIKDNGIVCRANNTATLGERKNMNLPGCKVLLPTLTEKDEDDLINFGLVTALTTSPLRSSARNFDEILAKTDGIMVARGDLGMEIPPETVFLAQKMMIRKANLADAGVDDHGPAPDPCRCTDVANAVLDGTDAVMLSGESANGDYPTQAVEVMSATCLQAETAIHYNDVYQSLRNAVLETAEAVASSAVKTAIDINAKMLVVLTETGNTARLVAKYRPEMPVLVLTALEQTARQTEGFVKGVVSRCVGSMIGTDSILYRATETGKDLGWLKKGDAVVAVHGIQEAKSGSTNLLKVLYVE